MHKKFKEQLELKFKSPLWFLQAELVVIDSFLDANIHFLDVIAPCFKVANKHSKDSNDMTVEQALRIAIYQRFKHITFDELTIQMADSISARAFCKISESQYFRRSTLHKNISKIDEETLVKLFDHIVLEAVSLGVDDGKSIRQDTTTMESEIHHPTNSALLWDVIRKASDFTEKMAKLSAHIDSINYCKQGKINHFKIVNCRGTRKMSAFDKRHPLFKNQLGILTKSINQLQRILILKLDENPLLDAIEKYAIENLYEEMRALIEISEKVQFMVFKKEIMKEDLSIDEKLFSIFETHTDCIVKGQRDVVFGHKVSVASGKSNLLFELELLKGNPADTKTFQNCLTRIGDKYQIIPENHVADGGYASKENHEFASVLGIKNNVFNKIRGSMQNNVSSKRMETLLKKWRAGIEAIISNLKRRYGLNRCKLKGWENNQCYVRWTGIMFNLTVIAKYILQ